MNAELIAVGTEILLGDIVNTDAQLISQSLSELCINVFYQTVVGDNPARLERVVREAKDRADIIITTGGLGPTLDDLTKETLATVFGKKMVLHQPSMDRLTDFFKTIGREMTKNNEKQAWLPEGCTVFTNLWGTAPGCAFEADGKHVLMLPGPPRECNPMWKECAMPYLYKLAGGCIVSRNIRVFGRHFTRRMQKQTIGKLHDIRFVNSGDFLSSLLFRIIERILHNVTRGCFGNRLQRNTRIGKNRATRALLNEINERSSFCRAFLKFNARV